MAERRVGSVWMCADVPDALDAKTLKTLRQGKTASICVCVCEVLEFEGKVKREG